jgi:flagellar hook-basal body complex protein FliE
MSDIEIQAVLQQMRAVAARAAAPAVPLDEGRETAFAGLLERALAEVNAHQQTAKRLSEAYERHDPSVSLTDVMIAMQKSSVAFQAILQVRNKLLAAYQEIMSMQI